MERRSFSLIDLFLRQLFVRNRIKPLYASRHIAIRNALDFQLVQTTEISDLLKGNRRVVTQPNSCGLSHNRCTAHRVSPINSTRLSHALEGADRFGPGSRCRGT